ncbi:hypothetical protein TVAG_328900 [Trichomonas vaginalis G3]|uniref:Uncharacterized protein n=1 Tax=Trichomonas vaginalis (strain ATCC PRA-98 / G3) TaxID=412133 RepID=A2EW32_TRIV3|nr:hypothetical protein TVAGG3_0687230 [Trichomonas vaginalis G3]EAY03118.1 hypothetical protein TVAG_328900 [Trichomonas vaginalis G3]KAI5508308.1 hypothetical protein TVAGG3_0687230 [Trichomonas vaginalis G3]|eukprot:XP_001315341.1 hypothetical protein [Trichomonas vaginalis G3]
MGDHDEYAYIFYSSAILQADKKIIEILLPPYFSASNVFPFIQKLHEDVSMFICNDIKLLDSNIENKNIERHAKHFTKCIISNMKLLPTTHLNILSLLQQNGFSELDVYSFFIRSIIIPQLCAMLSTSPFYGIINIFKHIALKSIDMYEVNTEPFSLSKTNSIFEVPRAFKKYGRRYLRFVTSIKDVQALFNASKKAMKLPPLLLKLGEMKNLAYLGYSPILFNVYPKEVSDGEIKIKDTIVFKDERRSVIIPKIPIYERIYMQLRQDALREKKFDLDYYDNSGKKKLYENLLQKAKENNLGDEFSSDASDETHDEKRPRYSMSEFSYNDSLEEISNDIIEPAKNNKTNNQINNTKPRESEISFRDFLILKQLKISKEHSYNFEILIELLFIQRQVANWHEIVQKNYDICVLSCANDFISTFNFSNSKSLKSHQKLIDYSSIFSSKSVICNYCSCRVEYILKEWQNETTNALVEKFGQIWIKNNLSKERKSLNTDNLPKSRRLIFGHSFHIISIIFENIGYVRFFRRYKQIIA